MILFNYKNISESLNKIIHNYVIANAKIKCTKAYKSAFCTH